jgi:hypothetical protein
LKEKTPITEKALKELTNIIPERLAEKPSGIVMVKPCMVGPFDPHNSFVSSGLHVF